jgi:hypothetical protein
MRLKTFNQLNEGKYDDFIEEVKKVVNYNEEDYEEGDEPTNADLLSEVGELMNKYNLTTDDLQQIVDENPDNWDIQTYVGSQLDFEKKDKSKKGKTMKNKDLFLAALDTLYWSWGSEAPAEVTWGANELLDWYEAEYNVELNIRFDEDCVNYKDVIEAIKNN